MIKAVLFDLDGTLLPMDNDEFVKYYLDLLCKKLAPYGYESKELVDAVWAGTEAMVKNNGIQMNDVVFWKAFEGKLGTRVRDVYNVFDEFYRCEFNQAIAVCKPNPAYGKLIKDLKKKGYRIVLATNPLFPRTATENRMRWAGLDVSDFELYTTYEMIGFSKPNPEYYKEILRRIEVSADEAIMIGNDVTEDMIAETIGMQVYLLTDYLINRRNVDISGYPHGDIEGIRKILTGKP